MAFWGIELKPGKPYVHHFGDDRGRLHLSQATLGSGKSSKKTIVQCNVGDKKPIYLCSLLPEKLENCALNLEFEEDEEVTFSVIGPHSIHLSGFFFGETEDDGVLDHYEGHVLETESETDDPLDYDSEDEDEDDFIDDDDDLEMYPSSPIRNSGVKIEEIVDDKKPTKEVAISKQTKKKGNHEGESDKKENSGKELVVRGTSVTPILESEDEDGFPISSPGKRKKDDLITRVTANETQDDNAGEEAIQKKGKDDFAPNRSLKRKADVVGQDDEHSREIGESRDNLAQVDNAAPGIDTKQKKKNKKKKIANKEVIAHETNGNNDFSKEENSGDMVQKRVADMGNVLEPNTEREKEKKNKKKKKKKKQETPVSSDPGQTISDKIGSKMEVEEKAENKSLQVRSFPNGLVIEELAMGKPDGKRATPGRKVSVLYIGKLKKNGKIFDSNIGRAPFKFRLGIGQVIKGWDIGVNGMRTGDKRRLTIPPAMGYGAQGAGAAIPPNSWLVFDVELVDVN
ncbi:peptidyl-prolyl cis-trans isomerase FKBP53-like isoform X1 [Coffea eugenioides]|uniref:peptidyl-prolyl cis-trans isomerase FKBP53-like isoform X1 n=1 Tax=Coffea eugenioides TaxID=49369 RepID=UPI000F610B62|nr:peptidyl-prolyl cis-trans isomerase FKBP53-like isoform X1 [Coffea eugenioides]